MAKLKGGTRIYGAATVDDGLNVTGVTTSTSFSGSGINLTGIVTSITAGTNITISGSTGNVTINSSGGGGSSSWTKKTSDYTAVAGDKIIADTTAGTFIVTLPASPTAGNSVVIADGGDWSIINLTIARNGSNIEGLADDFVFDIKGIIVEFVYEDSTTGWQLYAYTGSGTGGGSSGGASGSVDILEAMLFV